MKKIFLVVLIAFSAITATAQRGIKVAYIDMEYILDKVPDYAEAKNQLEQKAQKWKQEIQVKQNAIDKLKESLEVEKALLTKELIEEREEEIAFQEKELIDYQMEKFGPNGDLITQKSVLVKPIQDQVFNVIQDLSEARKYDFVFDKSSDLTILFAAKRHDISDLVVRRITSAAKRERMTNKQLQKLEKQEAQEDLEADPAYQARQEKLQERQEQREKLLEDRKAAREAKRKEYEERRAKLLEEREQKRREREAAREAARSGNRNTSTDDAEEDNNEKSNRPAAGTPDTTDDEQTVPGENSTQVKTTATEKPEVGDAETDTKMTAAEKARQERIKKAEERKKAAEERREKILAEREAARKAREEQRQKAIEERQNNSETTNEE
ncbi:hypothetical protein GCM10007424_22230 [Flavobacterium suaedae]|uniref:OmpH family outer membrane protein n=1 Tax=Flavobacterium suaedae TaxID=1767027 RepID=A0ABQ1JY10_9FLAO|nr:OmpH family outer membrane protein [Flavobacterium suaedae]GGB81696.1 hypothetical protein GCM10007424_22230 [Flavobacterium suaedae]